MTDPEIKRRLKAGRKRRRGLDRHADGQIKAAERERDVLSVAIDARKRHYGATDADARHAEYGYPLGVLEKKGHITEIQRKAGDEWIRIYLRYRTLKGLGSPNPRIAAYNDLMHGLWRRDDPEDEDVIKAQRLFQDVTREIRDGCAHEDMRLIDRAIRRILVEQVEYEQISQVDITHLRPALNVVARFLRLG